MEENLTVVIEAYTSSEQNDLNSYFREYHISLSNCFVSMLMQYKNTIKQLKLDEK